MKMIHHNERLYLKASGKAREKTAENSTVFSTPDRHIRKCEKTSDGSVKAVPVKASQTPDLGKASVLRPGSVKDLRAQTRICEKTSPIGSVMTRSALVSLPVADLLIRTRWDPWK